MRAVPQHESNLRVAENPLAIQSPGMAARLFFFRDSSSIRYFLWEHPIGCSCDLF